MPAEWEPHAATWLAWPHNRTDWPGKFAPIAYVYVEIVRHLARNEPVNLIVQNAAAARHARKLLGHAHVPWPNIKFHHWPTNRGWLRDSGPIFVRSHAPDARAINFREVDSHQNDTAGGSSSSRPGLLALHWRFNAWAKYRDWQLDNELPVRIAGHLGCALVSPEVSITKAQAARNAKPETRNVVLEGGLIDVNGCGTMITTRECLLSEVQARNPGLSQCDLERLFAHYLGIQKVIWLGRGIEGDDTHGHVDDIARFVRPTTVLAAVEMNRRDPNYKLLQENLRTLRAATDQDGSRLDVVELPMPAPVIYRRRRLPASYANFYIANRVVLAPVFNDPNDRLSLNTLAELFPDRQIVPIYCGDLIWGLGAIHCMTQQQPR